MAILNYFWDSCVFIAYLNNEEGAYDINSIESFLDDSKLADGCNIYTSSVIFAEVTPAKMKNSKYNNFSDFVSDFHGAITVIDASPIVNMTAGYLKDVKYKKNSEVRRVLTTGDAIMLASALELEDTYDVKIDAFHTFDNGKGPRSPEGKGIPLLSYQEWCEDVPSDSISKRIISMNRCKPIHNEPKLTR